MAGVVRPDAAGDFGLAGSRTSRVHWGSFGRVCSTHAPIVRHDPHQFPVVQRLADLVTSHAVTAAHIAFGHRAGTGAVQGCKCIGIGHVLAVDIVVPTTNGPGCPGNGRPSSRPRGLGIHLSRELATPDRSTSTATFSLWPQARKVEPQCVLRHAEAQLAIGAVAEQEPAPEQGGHLCCRQSLAQPQLRLEVGAVQCALGCKQIMQGSNRSRPRKP